MSSNSADVLVGRDAEVAALCSVLESSDASIALISGEPGVGKTRLVSEAMARTGATGLCGTSSPASLGRPFDLLLSAVEPSVRWWSSIPSDLAAVSQPLTRLLRSSAPGLANRDGEGEHAAPGELIGAGIALLRYLDVDLIVLDDIHWADVESLQIFERIVSAPAHPTIIASYRSEELNTSHPAAELVRLIERRHSPLHVHLEPFDTSQVAEYLLATFGQLRDEKLVDHLHARTGGSPFFLEQLIASGDTFASRSALPRSLAETIRLQLDELAEDERDLLAVAAVLGGRFEFDLLAAASGETEIEIIRKLRPVVARRIVVEDEVDVFRFRHELVRESILSWLLGRERRQLHERAFHALKVARPDDYAELARHATGASRIEDLVDLAPKGVQHYLAIGSTYQALRLAEDALKEFPDHPELCELAGRAAWLMGELDAAARHSGRWRSMSSKLDPDRHTEALVFAGRIAYERCDKETELDVVAALRCRLEKDDADIAEQARIMAALAQHHMLYGENPEAIECADQAVAMAEEAGLDEIRRRALIERNSSLMFDRDLVDDGRAALRLIAEECEQAGDDVGAARAWHNITVNSSGGDAEISLERMRQAAARCGFDSMAVHGFSFKKVDLAINRGDLHDAMSWASRSRLLGRGSRTRTMLTLVEALLSLETGDNTEARRLIHEMAPLAVALPIAEAVWFELLHVIGAAREGDAETARERLAAIPPSGEHPVMAVWMLRDLLDVGLPVSIVESFLDQASPDADEGALAAARALIAASLDPLSPESEAVLRDAREATIFCPGGKGHPEHYTIVVRAEVDIALARLLIGTGRTAEGRKQAKLAADSLERWPGARRDDALCLMSGGPVEEPTHAALTGREVDVARLVAKGMTNGQIAEELYIARKTVSSHVSHILTKLGVQSRTEIATWAVREGVATS